MNSAHQVLREEVGDQHQRAGEDRFISSAVRVTCSTSSKRRAPIAWAAKIEAAMPIDMAGNCT